MRPDTRSFSFTWLRGQTQKSTESTRQQQQSSEVYNNETEEQISSGEMSKDKEVNNVSGWSSRRGSTGSRLRKLGNSLVRLGGGQRYSSMSDVDEENWHKISEEPMPLDDDDFQDDDEDEVAEKINIRVADDKQPDVVVASLQAPQPMPFTTLNNNIGTTSTNAAGMSITKRLNKTVQDVKTTLGNFSQKFRKSTRRRYRMGPSTPGNGASPTRKILGRTPTKLYSPFGIDSPANLKTPKRLEHRPSTPRLARKSMISGLVYSPSNNFRRDLDEARRGMEDFQLLSRNIARRSVRF